MTINIAKMLGADIFATVDSEENRKLVVDLGIPESHVFDSRDLSFVKGTRRITQEYGVDVVLNSLSGRGLRASWECIAPYGRFVNLGKSDTSLLMAGLADNVVFASVDLQHIVMNNKALLRQLFEKTLVLVADLMVGSPAPLQSFPVSQIEEAFRLIEAGKDTGRTLITIEPKDVVPVRLDLPHSNA
jgi:NADPH:quinone reductase-like Zn-dependent oxidoreductase